MANGNGSRLNGWAQFVLSVVVMLVTVALAFGALNANVSRNYADIQAVESRSTAADADVIRRLERMEEANASAHAAIMQILTELNRKAN